jgi:hypothetical protein
MQRSSIKGTLLRTVIGLLAVAALPCQFAFGQPSQSGGLKLPLKGSAEERGPLLDVTNRDGSDLSIGILGQAYNTGVQGQGFMIGVRGAGGQVGVSGFSQGGIGVAGSSQTGSGVNGTSIKSLGIKGLSIESTGVGGESSSATGVFGITHGTGDQAKGVAGEAKEKDAIAVYGRSIAGFAGFFQSETSDGVRGISRNGTGVVGIATGAGGGAKGIAGEAREKGAVAVYGQSTAGFAGFFRGRVTITDSLLVDKIYAKEITGSRKLFQIDDPLDPADKYLTHVAVESDQMINSYSGNVTLGPDGTVWVNLPNWFEALNTDFRYQLTPVGSFAPVYIAHEIQNRRFRIAGGKPELKISWQVIGVRKDAYAKAHPIQVEQEKPEAERGHYLHPVELGLPESRGIRKIEGGPLK